LAWRAVSLLHRSRSKRTLAQQCHKISLHIILIGLMGTFYECRAELLLGKLGQDLFTTMTLTVWLKGCKVHLLVLATSWWRTTVCWWPPSHAQWPYQRADHALQLEGPCLKELLTVNTQKSGVLCFNSKSGSLSPLFFNGVQQLQDETGSAGWYASQLHVHWSQVLPFFVGHGLTQAFMFKQKLLNFEPIDLSHSVVDLRKTANTWTTISVVLFLQTGCWLLILPTAFHFASSLTFWDKLFAV